MRRERPREILGRGSSVERWPFSLFFGGFFFCSFLFCFRVR